MLRQARGRAAGRAARLLLRLLRVLRQAGGRAARGAPLLRCGLRSRLLPRLLHLLSQGQETRIGRLLRLLCVLCRAGTRPCCPRASAAGRRLLAVHHRLLLCRGLQNLLESSHKSLQGQQSIDLFSVLARGQPARAGQGRAGKQPRGM